ncbi:unnamed protein product [Parajaminaea phylloscopi]
MATTTTTSTAARTPETVDGVSSRSTAAAAAAAAPAPALDISGKVRTSKFNPTWHHKSHAEMSFFEKSLVDLGILQDKSGSERPPVHAMDEPVPVCTVWEQHRWIFPRAIAPLLVNFLFTKATGISVPRYVAFPIFTAYFIAWGSSLFRMLSKIVKKHGCFDGSHPRDGIPDEDTTQVALELSGVVGLRALVAFTFIYPADQSDLLNWNNMLLLPLRLFAHAVTLDFYFYWYHRLMHEVPWLWQFHRKHHTTKHPSAAHGAYADHEQEMFDIIGIPFMAFATLYYTPLRLDFASWWMAITYTLFIEAGGHSGARAYFSNPTAYFPLKQLGMELCLEDHDLHHRRGWKKASNYGKQTRLWDTIFGTKGERIEGHADNLDWVNTVKLG